MINLATDEIRRLMNNTDNIRNVSIVGNIGHGKSTIRDSLFDTAGINIGGEARSEDEDARREQARQEKYDLTLRSTNTLLYMRLEEGTILSAANQPESSEYLVNLIDTPGHVDFSSEVTAAVRISDGALVVVDCQEGITIQTEAVIRQALDERVKLILVINKIDRAVLELTKEELYQSLLSTVTSFNIILATHCGKGFKHRPVSPVENTVVFSSGLHGWAFTCRQFAAKYARKFGVDLDKMCSRLWGDCYWNSVTKKWTRHGTHDGQVLERGFNQFCLDVIYRIANVALNGTREELHTILNKLDAELTPGEKGLKGKQLLNVAMREFLPSAEAILNTAILLLPSPKAAQTCRVSTLYDGALDDWSAVAIRDCNPNSALMLYVSKMSPASDGRFHALGRVFAGTVQSGHKACIRGPNYKSGRKEDVFVKTVEQVGLMVNGNIEPLDDCPAGNIVSLVGIDRFLLNSGTVTTDDIASNFKAMRFATLPVIQRSVDVKHPADLPKLVEGLRRLSRSDAAVLLQTSESGAHIVAGAGELHLTKCLEDLEGKYAGVPLSVSKPYVCYRESVSAKSSMVALAKSPNKYNRFYATAEPLGEKLTQAIVSGKTLPTDDFKARARVLADNFQWDITDGRRTWCFGPDSTGPNVVVDQTKAVQYLNEIKDSFISGFQWASKEGPLVEEPLHGVRFNITDVTLLASDGIRRGGGQVIPAARRVTLASMMLAEPVLLEPTYLLEVATTESCVSDVREMLTSRRGRVIDEKRAGARCILKAYIPVHESFGFEAELRKVTGGHASLQAVFHRFETLAGGSPLDPATVPGQVAVALRERKGLKRDIPPYTVYCDKL